MEKWEKIHTYLFDAFIFIFIISMFNREFLPLGLDLRYIQFALAIILLMLFGYDVIYKQNINEINFKNKKYITLIIIFYIYIFLVNLRWLNNNLIINKSDFINMLVLSFSNMLSIVLFYINMKKINMKKVNIYLIVSFSLLLISMILISFGFKLETIMGGPYKGYYGGVENINLFGKEGRIAGYAQDPNYASFFMWITLITNFYYTENKIIKYIVIFLAVFGIALSASKTILIAMIFSLIFIPIIKLKKYKFKNIIPYFFVIPLVSLPYIIVKIMTIFNRSFNMDTMSTRLAMWKRASELFEKNIIFGNGITSFRSYFESQSIGWYVHSHSTIFQILSETGIIGIILFSAISIYILKLSDDYFKYIIIVFLIFSLTTELLHLTVFSFVLGLIPCYLIKENKDKYLVDSSDVKK